MRGPGGGVGGRKEKKKNHKDEVLFSYAFAFDAFFKRKIRGFLNDSTFYLSLPCLKADAPFFIYSSRGSPALERSEPRRELKDYGMSYSCLSFPINQSPISGTSVLGRPRDH